MFTKKAIWAFLSFIMVVAMLTACTAPATPTATKPTDVPKVKAILIANRPVGDKGSIDNQVDGLNTCAKDLGYETKVLESTSPDRYEEDIRAMAKAGYDLIITAFPPVTEAVKAVAKDYPKIKFVGIYEFGNTKDPLANLWDTEYQSQELTYVLGAFATKLTKSKKLGYISGQETASGNSGINGWFDGIKANCPECTAEYAYVGNYTDLAKAKEMAKAMISRGVDVFQTAAGAASQGVVEAAKEAGVLVVGDNTDLFDVSKETYISWMFTDFGANVVLACKDFKSGNFQGGKHTYMNMANGGAAFMWDKVDRFITANPTKADMVTAAKKYALDIQSKVVSGTTKVTFNPNTPTNLAPSK